MRNLNLIDQTWREQNTHYLYAVKSGWYKILLDINDLISYYSAVFYRELGIIATHFPVTTGSISSPMGLGSDSKPVSIELFGQQTYLADSMQFMLEYGCRFNKKGCYYIMPTFRGENADKRHLCQFYHSEAEILGTLDDVMALVERYIKYLSKNILAELGDKIEAIIGSRTHIEKLIEMDSFPRMTFQQAQDLLDGQEGCFEDHGEYQTITSIGEKKLIELAGGIVWITHYDYISVPFYQASDEGMKRALNADLLFGIGEVVGAGQRHEDAEKVLQALQYHKVAPEDYEWYIKMKTEFPLQTSGFGMGEERFILWLLGHDDIRDCQVIPRFNGVYCNM